MKRQHRSKSGQARGPLAAAIKRYASDPRLTIAPTRPGYTQQVMKLAKQDGIWTQLGGI